MPALAEIVQVSPRQTDPANERKNNFEAQLSCRKPNRQRNKSDGGNDQNRAVAVEFVARIKCEKAGGENDKGEQQMHPWALKPCAEHGKREEENRSEGAVNDAKK